MRNFAALMVVVGAISGWSSADAAETRILGFAFGCETAEGHQVTPKFGDIEGLSYSDLPAQSQLCRKEVQRQIAQCRENTDFGSDTKNWELAECLPLFREQAQMCVGHFERELAKCGGSAVTSTGTLHLDSSERQQLQAALAAAGFDPGLLDGMFGPKTRRAIQAWQEAKGYTATGELTTAQIEALLDGAGILGGTGSHEPFGSDWTIAENQPCHVYNPTAKPGETVTWSGGCVGGKAFGEGRLVFNGGYGEDVYEGTMRDGKMNGYGTYTHHSGHRIVADEWRDNIPNGYGTATDDSGSRSEGKWFDGTFVGD